MFVLAVSSSTIKKLSEYMILKVLLFSIPASLVKRFKSYSTAKEIRIKARTPRRLVPIVVVEILSLLVGAGLISLALNPGPVEEQPVASYAPKVLFGSSAGYFST